MKFLIIQENGRHEVSKHLRECNSMNELLLQIMLSVMFGDLDIVILKLFLNIIATMLSLILKIMIQVGCQI